MGRLAQERKIHVPYPDWFVDYWKAQPDEFKNTCTDIGKPYGYSGQNVFFFFLWVKLLETDPDYTHKPWHAH